MKMLKISLLLLLSVSSLLFTATQVASSNIAISDTNKFRGEVHLTALIYDSAVHNFTVPLLPPNRILVHYQYLIEEQRVNRQLTIGDHSSENKSDIVGYYFIDLEKSTCSEYESLSIAAQRKKIYGLGEKKLGFHFINNMDYFKDVLTKLKEKDTIWNSRHYRLLIAETEMEGNPLKATAYLDAALHSLPIHLSTSLDNKYNGIVTRMDVESKLSSSQKISFRMEVSPGILQDSILNIINHWKRQ